MYLPSNSNPFGGVVSCSCFGTFGFASCVFELVTNTQGPGCLFASMHVHVCKPKPTSESV